MNTEEQKLVLKWTCEACGATGPMPDDILLSPHDCVSRGPFDQIARLLVSVDGEVA